MFDRDYEWAALARYVGDEQPGAMLGVVSGRRRQGKTFLLDAVCRVAGGFYFGATEATDAESLRRLSAALTAYVRPASPYHFANWAEAVDALLALGSERPVPVVIDEFPYLARANPELPSIIQEAHRPLREERTRSRARVLLCGSALSFMGRLLSGNAPLRGRAGLELVVRPLDHQLAAIVVFAIVNASCVVRCGGSVVGWETADGVVALRDARLASRTCVRDRRVAVEATILWSLCDLEDRDHSKPRRHRAVTISSRTGVPTKLGTASKPATLFGSCANLAITPRTRSK